MNFKILIFYTIFLSNIVFSGSNQSSQKDDYNLKFLKSAAKTKTNEELLLTAVNLRNLEYVKKAIDNGADLNMLHNWKDDGKFYVPILIAAVVFSKTNLEIINTLIDNGSNVNLQATNGDTALMVAACLARYEAVDLLLKKGADPTLKNDKDKSFFDCIPIKSIKLKKIYEDHTEFVNKEINQKLSRDTANIVKSYLF